MHIFAWGIMCFPMLCAQSTYQLSFTQLESDICKATLIVVHRLPTGFRNKISPTCAGHNGLFSTPTNIIQTRTRERMNGTNVGLRPTQWDWGKIGIKGIVLNCFTSICRIKQGFVSWLHMYHLHDKTVLDGTYHIFPYSRLLLANQFWELRRHSENVVWVHLGCL